jgi:hypothetical protein
VTGRSQKGRASRFWVERDRSSLLLDSGPPSGFDVAEGLRGESARCSATTHRRGSTGTAFCR